MLVKIKKIVKNEYKEKFEFKKTVVNKNPKTKSVDILPFSNLLDLAFCNMQEKFKYGKIEFYKINNNISRFLIKNQKKNIKTIGLETFKLELNRDCGRSDCLKCKRQKGFSYIKSRIFDNVKNSYFVTISSNLKYDDFESEYFKLLYSDYRLLVKNFFDFYKIPAITSFEIEGKNGYLHSHSIVLNPQITSIELTNKLRFYSGFYVNSEIIDLSDRDKIDSYMSKIVGYSSKFAKDTKQIDKFNAIPVSENESNFIKNYPNNLSWNGLNVSTIKDIETLLSSTKVIVDMFKTKGFTVNTDRKYQLFLNSYIIQKRVKFFYRVLDDIKFYNLGAKENQTLSLKQKQQVIETKQVEFIKKWWRGSETIFNAINKAFLFLRDTSCIQDGVFSAPYVFNSGIKKRISSNIKTENIENLYHQQYNTGGGLYIKDEFDVLLKEFHTSIKNSAVIETIKQQKGKIKNEIIKNENNVSSAKFRSFDIDRVFYNRCVKNSLYSKNGFLHYDILINEVLKKSTIDLDLLDKTIDFEATKFSKVAVKFAKTSQAKEKRDLIKSEKAIELRLLFNSRFSL